ncbi:MAG TPA: aldo/keto reductase [Casimicrobiaceae bacterium]|jgi:D-threo-aldose 1-dehydrogenase
MSLSIELTKTLRSTPLGLGGAPLGNLFRAVRDEDARATIRHAAASGIRYFDTAPHYGHGLSERRFGDALRTVSRDSYLLSTKVGRLLEPDPRALRDQHGYVDVLPFNQRYDYSYDGTLRSLEDSLQRLGLARVDIAYVHDIDAATHGNAQPRRFREAMDGALPALARLKSEGAVGGYGIGVNDVQVCLDTMADADIDVILLAGRYTLADQSALATLLPSCVRRNVAIVAAGVFNSGILATGSKPLDGSRPYFNYAAAPADIVARVAAIETVCAEFEVPLQAAALQFPTAHPAVVNVLVGARSTKEVDANLSFARFPIPADFWTALGDRRLVDSAAPLPASPVR